MTPDANPLPLSPLSPLLPPSCLGVMGGGQLARMFVHAAQRMGYQTAVLEPQAFAPASEVTHHQIATDYDDPQGLQRMAECAQAITTEFENVPQSALAQLAQTRIVSPSAQTVAIAQDRALEKAAIEKAGFPVAPYQALQLASEINDQTLALLPGILKTTRMGYDGKGQTRIATVQELKAALHATGQHPPIPHVLEKQLPLVAECSVVLARGANAQVVHLPVQHNVHRHGILFCTSVFPDWIDDALGQELVQASQALAHALNYVGVLCVEFFILKSGHGPNPYTWVINEIAPRPHNSGHHSLDSCDQSQFELQVRTLAQLPLTPPVQHSPCLMLNLMGELWLPEHTSAQPQEPDWASILALPGTHLHLYGKSVARPGRKMGHLTLTAKSPEEVLKTYHACCELLHLLASDIRPLRG